jgi:predicted nucleic acid-binding Zn ribbon protein
MSDERPMPGQMMFEQRDGRTRYVGVATICACCGETFAAKRSDAVTCSPACRQTLYRRRQGVRARIYNGRDLRRRQP